MDITFDKLQWINYLAISLLDYLAVQNPSQRQIEKVEQFLQLITAPISNSCVASFEPCLIIERRDILH